MTPSRIVTCVLATLLGALVANGLLSGCGSPSSQKTDETASWDERLPVHARNASAPHPGASQPTDTSVPAPQPDLSVATDRHANAPIKPGDWPQWGGTSYRNNTPQAENIPTTWEVGDVDRQSGQWIPDRAQNVKWVARLGSQTYGNPVVAGGRVWVGTNNGSGYLARYPADVDLGCLLCFDESDGRFLWQASSEKLPSGGAQDWPLQGICCSPLVEGDRLWYVTSRGEVVCLDAAGYYDKEDDGLTESTPVPEDVDLHEADTVWTFDMMAELNVSQHNMASCSVTALGDILFVNTSNGVDESDRVVAVPEAPSFLAMNKHTGALLWTDNSPGANILHGQWSSPAAGVLGGVPQVIFAGGDGWVYSFRADDGQSGRPELLWKFDANPKETKWILGGAGTRSNIIATPVIYEGLIYVVLGDDPESGEGVGSLWCIDPTKRGDVSPTLAVRADDHSQILPVRREQAVIVEQGEEAIPNPNSAAVWGYSQVDQNGDGQIDFEEEMHRSLGTPAIQNDLLLLADFAGLVHCVDAKSGKVHWVHDLLAAAWGSPVIVDGRVYIGDEDGDVCVFKLSADKHEPVSEVNLGNSVYSTPTIANGVLFIATRTHLIAIASSNP
ncbi:MAG: outer membrane protein assembly factor BamB family protein [Pirellulaceae bacterium]